MSLLLVTTEFPPYPGGIATYSRSMAVNYPMVCNNASVTVICPDFDDYNFNIPSIELDRYPGGIFKKSDVFRLFKKVYFNLIKKKFDVIHAADWPSIFVLGLLNKFFLNRPYIATVYGSEIFLLSRLQKNKLFRYFLFYRCKKIVAISQYSLSLAQEHLFGIEDRLSMAYLGIGVEFCRNKESSFVSTKYHIQSNDRVILSVSRIERRKGHLEAVKAMSGLPEYLKKKIFYVVIGKVVDENYYNEVCDALSTSGIRYIFVGAVPFREMLDFYDVCELFLLPGGKDGDKVEGFGLVYLEAASQGAPSIAFRLNAVPEVVLDGVSGLLVDEGDISGMTGCIKKLLEDQNLRLLLSSNAKKRASEFTWSSCAAKTYCGHY